MSDSKTSQMSESSQAPTHPIQQHIIQMLENHSLQRFRDMRPADVETNLYSYHLKVLQREGRIMKLDDGRYSLSTSKGQQPDNNLAEQCIQPVVVVMLVLQNSNGDVLLQRVAAEDTWSLPTDNIRVSDKDIQAAAYRAFMSEMGVDCTKIIQAGTCYIRAEAQTLAHVFYLEVEDAVLAEDMMWARPHKLTQYKLAPAVEAIVARTFFRDPYFFEEYTEQLIQ